MWQAWAPGWLWWRAWLLGRCFAWQVWHLMTSTSLLCGRCGTCCRRSVSMTVCMVCPVTFAHGAKTCLCRLCPQPSPWCWHDPFWHNSFASKTLVTYNSWSFTHNSFTRNSSTSETLTHLAFTIQLFYIFPRQLSRATLHRQFFSPPIFHT